MSTSPFAVKPPVRVRNAVHSLRPAPLGPGQRFVPSITPFHSRQFPVSSAPAPLMPNMSYEKRSSSPKKVVTPKNDKKVAFSFPIPPSRLPSSFVSQPPFRTGATYVKQPLASRASLLNNIPEAPHPTGVTHSRRGKQSSCGSLPAHLTHSEPVYISRVPHPYAPAPDMIIIRRHPTKPITEKDWLNVVLVCPSDTHPNHQHHVTLSQSWNKGKLASSSLGKQSTSFVPSSPVAALRPSDHLQAPPVMGPTRVLASPHRINDVISAYLDAPSAPSPWSVARVSSLHTSVPLDIPTVVNHSTSHRGMATYAVPTASIPCTNDDSVDTTLSCITESQDPALDSWPKRPLDQLANDQVFLRINEILKPLSSAPTAGTAGPDDDSDSDSDSDSDLTAKFEAEQKAYAERQAAREAKFKARFGVSMSNNDQIQQGSAGNPGKSLVLSAAPVNTLPPTPAPISPHPPKPVVSAVPVTPCKQVNYFQSFVSPSTSQLHSSPSRAQTLLSIPVPAVASATVLAFSSPTPAEIYVESASQAIASELSPRPVPSEPSATFSPALIGSTARPAPPISLSPASAKPISPVPAPAPSTPSQQTNLLVPLALAWSPPLSVDQSLVSSSPAAPARDPFRDSIKKQLQSFACPLPGPTSFSGPARSLPSRAVNSFVSNVPQSLPSPLPWCSSWKAIGIVAATAAATTAVGLAVRWWLS